MKAYVDTNILIDLVCAREPFFNDAKSLFALGYRDDVDLSISALSFVNTMYIGRKYQLTKEQLIHSLTIIADFVDVLDLRGRDVVDMLASGWKDYEDATQHAGALLANADCIVTRNKKDFLMATIPVYTIEEFLQK